MKKEFFIFRKKSIVPITIRNYSLDDADQLINLQRKSFPPPFPDELLWNKEQISEHINRFPEGALCIEADRQLVGSITTLRVNLKQGEAHTWEQITDSGYIRNHVPDGNTLYVVDICVDPDFRGAGLGKELMRAMYETVVYLGIERLAGGSRMPGFKHYADKMSPEDYFLKIKQGELQDPVVTFLIKAGRVPVDLLPGYLPDEESSDHAVLMEWRNPFFSP